MCNTLASDLESINSSKQRDERTLQIQVGETIRSSASSFFSFFLPNTLFFQRFISPVLRDDSFALKTIASRDRRNYCQSRVAW